MTGGLIWYIIDIQQKTKQCVEAAEELSRHYRIEDRLLVGDSVSGPMAYLDLMYNPDHDIDEEIEKHLELKESGIPQILEINSIDETTKFKIYIPDGYRNDKNTIVLDNVVLHKKGESKKAKAVYAYVKDDDRYILEFDRISSLNEYILSFTLNDNPLHLVITNVKED